MKIYNNGGFKEMNTEEFLRYVSSENLKIEIGEICSLKILERKFLSNKGNALDGIIECEDKVSVTGLNIGGNPIGTGYNNYIPFLDEMRCKKMGGLYMVDSLIGKSVIYLTNSGNTRGIVTPKGFRDVEKLVGR